MIVSCICHDLDHRGTNNAFQAKSGSPLAMLYGTKNTMEQHHFNQAVMILNCGDQNILSDLGSEEFSRLLSVMKHCILATDLYNYFQWRPKFLEMSSDARTDWRKEENRRLLQAMLMTGCDLAASTKPWPIQYKVAQLVTTEFFDQGDKEKRELNLTPSAQMDRNRIHELPSMQSKWIEEACLPLYAALSVLDPALEPMRAGAEDNLARWKGLSRTGGCIQSDL
ncbi:unnamed protein product [Darwinula stevensoni]|uniref:PDEase domain-containing protein n=1 Tax=Darwinula stevensoni TaxID=69355 RepID=A0A7R8X589_9CRUS|nr:unnamed protein product [Darwinula stevensoni]CAG0886388.1 unnamed protein product [Darwinula stevensoni]